MTETLPQGDLPPIYFTVGVEVFQNRRGQRAVLIATAITRPFAVTICEALNQQRTEAQR